MNKLNKHGYTEEQTIAYKQRRNMISRYFHTLAHTVYIQIDGSTWKRFGDKKIFTFYPANRTMKAINKS